MPLRLNPFKSIMQAAVNIASDRLLDIAESAAEIASDLSPHLTGNNAGSIAEEKINNLHYRIFTTSNYGAWLELGTRKMPARPYMLPAIQEANAEAGL